MLESAELHKMALIIAKILPIASKHLIVSDLQAKGRGKFLFFTSRIFFFFAVVLIKGKNNSGSCYPDLIQGADSINIHLCLMQSATADP